MVATIHYRWDFIGLSTQEKPTPETSDKVVDGSTFYSSDDSKLYVWYNDQWYERKALGGGGGGGSTINVVQTTGTSTTDVMSQKAVTDALAGAGGGPTVVQSTGTSDANVMSQNATSSMVFADPATQVNIKIGGGSSATNPSGCVTIGERASGGRDAVTIGSQTTGGVSGSVTIGHSAYGTSNSVAIGYSASSGNRSESVAIGHSASTGSAHPGSVALGSYATCKRAGEVNIGSTDTSCGYNSTNYRVLGGVHDPVDDHDAANKTYVDTLIAALEARVAAIEGK